MISLMACQIGPRYELSQSTEKFTEYLIYTNNNDTFPTQKAVSELNQAGEVQDLTGDTFEETHYGYAVVGKGLSEEEIAALNADQPCSNCYEIRTEEDTYLIEEASASIQISKNGALIYEHSSYFSSDGPIIKIQMLDSNLIVSYMDGAYTDDTKSDFDVWVETFWEGGIPEAYQDFEGIRAVFKYNEKIGFLAKNPEDGLLYVYYDGQVMSPGYDGVPLTQCCMQEPPHFYLHTNGTLTLVGTREHEFYFLEVQLGTAD